MLMALTPSPLVPGWDQLCGVAADLALRWASKSSYLISPFEADEALLRSILCRRVWLWPVPFLDEPKLRLKPWDTPQMYPARFAEKAAVGD
jgi:hypothetical protein